MKRRTFLRATLAAVALTLSAGSLALRAAVARVSAVRTRRRAMRLPPLPKWNRTTDDIDSNDFFRRSQDYERSLMPPDIVFPRAGQVWETVRDCEVQVLNWMIETKAPMLWTNARLRQGERVRILQLDDPKPLSVRFKPVGELHERIAPHSSGYELRIRMARTVPGLGEGTGYFNELFRLVEDAG